MNNDFRKLSRVIVAVLVVALPFLIAGCAPESKTPSSIPAKIELSELEELERNITIQVEGETVHYSEERKWAENEFSNLTEEKDRFSFSQIEEFKATYQVDAANFDLKVNEEERSTILKCDIYVELDSWYDFHWFLRPLGLDFIDDHFEKSERELSWEGSLDEVKTTILLRFDFKIDNCHAHVWAKDKV